LKSASELATVIGQCLEQCGYREVSEGRGNGVELHTVLSTPRETHPRLMCVVAEIPPSAHSARDGLRFMDSIRRSLAKQHKGFPWPKRMGTYAVLVGEHDLCEAIRGREGSFVDTSGLHVNVLLGTIFVDKKTFRARGDNVFGLIDAGDHFARIQRAVDEWSRAARRASGTFVTNGRALSVA